MMVWWTVPWDQTDQAFPSPLGLRSDPEIQQAKIQQTDLISTNCSNVQGGSLLGVSFHPMGWCFVYTHPGRTLHRCLATRLDL